MGDPTPPPDEAPMVAQSPDEFERQYMSAGGSVIHTRQAMPWWFFALMGAVALVEVGAAIAAHNPVSLLTLPLLAVVSLVLSHVRVTVTAESVDVKLGLWGPKVLLSQIERCEAKPYEAMRFGGWGIKRAVDGTWAYSVPGGAGEGVELHWRDAKGALRKTFVTTPRAAEVAVAIERGRAAQRTTGVRVDAASDRAAADVDEAVAEPARSAATKRG